MKLSHSKREKGKGNISRIRLSNRMKCQSRYRLSLPQNWMHCSKLEGKFISAVPYISVSKSMPICSSGPQKLVRKLSV